MFNNKDNDNNNLNGNQGNKNSGAGNSEAHNKKQFFIETIAKYCDKCGIAYSVNDLHIVQESNFSSIIHFSCSNCKSNHIATFIKPMGMSSRVPVNTDLGVSEISKFAKNEKVSSNEVLELYEVLEGSDEKLSV